MDSASQLTVAHDRRITCRRLPLESQCHPGVWAALSEYLRSGCVAVAPELESLFTDACRECDCDPMPRTRVYVTQQRWGNDAFQWIRAALHGALYACDTWTAGATLMHYASVATLREDFEDDAEDVRKALAKVASLCWVEQWSGDALRACVADVCAVYYPRLGLTVASMKECFVPPSKSLHVSFQLRVVRVSWDP